jgi:hypothetical protein
MSPELVAAVVVSVLTTGSVLAVLGLVRVLGDPCRICYRARWRHNRPVRLCHGFTSSRSRRYRR